MRIINSKTNISSTANIQSFFIFILFSVIFSNAYSQNTRESIAKSFTNKSILEIKNELTKTKSQIIQMQSLSSLRISGGPAKEVGTKYINNFSADSSLDIFLNYFNHHLKEVSLHQKINNDTSFVSIKEPYNLRDYPNSYSEFNLEKPKLSLKTVYSKNGKRLKTRPYEDYFQEFYSTNLKKIDSVSLLFKYQYLKKIDKITLNKKQKTAKQKKIILSSIVDDKIEFKVDSLLAEKIIYIEAIDSTGKALWKKSSFTSSSNTKPQELYLSEVVNMITTIVEKINTKKITSKDKLIDYLYKNQPTKNNSSKKASKKIYYNTYAGKVTAIHIYTNPVIVNKEESITVLNTTSYINGVTIATKNDKDGLINTEGKWVVSPNYERISKYFIPNYFYIDSDSDRKLHVFNKEKKKLIPVNYRIPMKRIYNDRYLKIYGDYNTEVGLIDLKTQKIILSPIERDLEVDSKFYLSEKKIDSRNNSYEIFRFSDHKKIIEDTFYEVIFNDDLIIVKYNKEIPEKPKGLGYVSSVIKGVKKYYYTYTAVYNKNGEKINKTLYNYPPDNAVFGKDNLLLVDKKKDRTKSDYEYAFINKNGQEQNFDLTAYEKVKSFSNGLAIVKDKISGNYGFINTKGALVIPTIYDSANHFIGGSAMVNYTDKKGKYKTALINNQNKIIFTFPEYVYSYTSKHDAKKAKYITRNKGKFNHKGEKIK